MHSHHLPICFLKTVCSLIALCAAYYYVGGSISANLKIKMQKLLLVWFFHFVSWLNYIPLHILVSGKHKFTYPSQRPKSLLMLSSLLSTYQKSQNIPCIRQDVYLADVVLLWLSESHPDAYSSCEYGCYFN